MKEMKYIMEKDWKKKFKMELRMKEIWRIWKEFEEIGRSGRNEDDEGDCGGENGGDWG